MRAVDPDELKWRARSDARTLAEAEEIKADKTRMALAQKEAQNILAEEQSRIKGISKVAGKPVAMSTPVKKERDIRRNNNVMPYGGFPTTPTM